MESTDASRRDMSADDVELYDRTRLELPAPLVLALLERIPPGPDRRLLEVGAGTGRTTFLLVVTRNEITALEPNRHRGAFAADRLALYPKVLRPGGLLVLVYVRQIAGGDDKFLADAHECRRQLDPGTEPSFPLPTADQLARRADISDSGHFKEPRVRRKPWDVTYSASEYVDFEMNYTHTRALPEPTRTEYLDGIAALIKQQYGGRVTMRYLYEMQTAERRRQVRVRQRGGGAGSGDRSTTTDS